MNMRRNKKFLTVVAAIIILAVIIPASRNIIKHGCSYVFSPLFSAISNSSYRTRGFFFGLSEINKLKEQNQKLTEKLTASQIDKNDLVELKLENETLKKQLGFIETHKDRELVPAKIIGRDPVSYLGYIIIDKGTSDGIMTGMAVITDGALVGKVTDAQIGSATVTLITSKKSLVQAMLQTSRVQGILRGGMSGIVLDNIPQDIEAKNGEMVITSGLGGDIEQGIMIGTISGTESSKAEIFKTLSIQPIVDFTKLELVFVLK